MSARERGSSLRLTRRAGVRAPYEAAGYPTGSANFDPDRFRLTYWGRPDQAGADSD